MTGGHGRMLSRDDLLRLKSIAASLRARHERLRELIGEVSRLEQEVDSELVDVQDLAAEGKLILRRCRETP